MTFQATTNKVTRGGFREEPREYFQAREYFQVDSSLQKSQTLLLYK